MVSIQYVCYIYNPPLHTSLFVGVFVKNSPYKRKKMIKIETIADIKERRYFSHFFYKEKYGYILYTNYEQSPKYTDIFFVFFKKNSSFLRIICGIFSDW